MMAMTDTGEHILSSGRRRSRVIRPGSIQPFVAILVLPLLGVLYQIYVPNFFEQLGYLELPLLIIVYYSLAWRSQIAALFFGAAVGLMQDALSHHYVGLFGITKTLVGYFAASMSLRFDVDNAAIRFILSFFFFVFHQFFYWIMVRALLGLGMAFEPAQMFIQAGLNAVVAIPLFIVLDKLNNRWSPRL
jgi:rod shape-determining protein MreD